MKKGKKKNQDIKKRNSKKVFDIKKTILFKILIFCVILLMVLIVLYFIIYEPRIKEKGLGGGLGTLCIFCSDNPIVLGILNYTIASDNLSIDVNINWSTGNVSISDFNSILVDFDMSVGDNCNFSISSDIPGFGENKTYSIVGFNPSCLETNFSKVTNVLAYAEVDIHLIQTGLIPGINFYKDDSRNNLLYLNNYFHALTEINYSVIESPSNANIEVVVNNLTKNISISVLDGTWFGTQRFNLTARTEDGDVLPAFFNIIVINDTRPIINNEPEFDEDECGDFSWNKNTNMTVDIDDCWDDEDGDNLNYEYSDLNNYEENISIIKLSGDRLKFVPDIGFNGSTYLTFYANDSIVRVSHRVNLHILSNNTNTSTPVYAPSYTPPTYTSPINNLEIKSPSPVSSRVSFFVNEPKRFSILAENYEYVEWYVNNALVKEGVLSYDFEETRPGLYIIKVSIINGSLVENQIWEVSIEEDEYIEDRIFDVSVGQVIFYSIIVVLSIIIVLVVWLLIINIKKRNRKMDLGFGVSVVPNRGGFSESSKQFNIPKD